jgi:EARLY FLOWERING 3 protein
MKVAKDVKGDDGKNGMDKAGTESGLLFPRLNLKETKTSGPRAPPRNKMALYEQFTIPSHRFVQPSHSAARQNPSPLLNQPVCLY